MNLTANEVISWKLGQGSLGFRPQHQDFIKIHGGAWKFNKFSRVAGTEGVMIAGEFGHPVSEKGVPRIYALFLTSRTTVATEPISIRVIKLAATNLGAPFATACQLAMDRQPNTAQSITHVAKAAHLANPSPFPSRIPQAIESPPNVDPVIRAVTAAAGFDAYPASPQIKRKNP
jgi:hypothetical protein